MNSMVRENIDKENIVGLRTKETEAFTKYFKVIQEKAANEDSIFYLDTEDGNNATIDNMEVCDLWGWLIPYEKTYEFEKIWKNKEEDDDWVDYYLCAEWRLQDDGEIEIDFVDYPYE